MSNRWQLVTDRWLYWCCLVFLPEWVVRHRYQRHSSHQLTANIHNVHNKTQLNIFIECTSKRQSYHILTTKRWARSWSVTTQWLLSHPGGRLELLSAGMVEINGSYRLGEWQKVIRELTACTPGSAPDPTLGNEYGRTLAFTVLPFVQQLKMLVLSSIWTEQKNSGKISKGCKN